MFSCWCFLRGDKLHTAIETSYNYKCWSMRTVRMRAYRKWEFHEIVRRSVHWQIPQHADITICSFHSIHNCQHPDCCPVSTSSPNTLQAPTPTHHHEPPLTYTCYPALRSQWQPRWDCLHAPWSCYHPLPHSGLSPPIRRSPKDIRTQQEITTLTPQ